MNGCYYNDEIKVGEYVRTKYGKILKIDGPRDMGYIEKGNPYFRQQISKHSSNTIDLIEANDYVNGRKVQQVFTDPFTKKKRLLIEGTELNWQGDMSSIYCEADEIKSIVTHQQFKSIEYTIHEREEKENGQ